MSIRIRRLQAEYERLMVVFDGHAHIRIAEVSGRPPDRYVVEYNVPGLVEEGGEIRGRGLHRAEISLGANYPREMPRCVMLTPVFHPNIDHLSICTEDFGSAGQTLDQTIIFIGKMITFQVYNLQSPRNGDAARWTNENLGRLPLHGVDLVPPVLLQGGTEVEVALLAAAALRESGLDAPAPPNVSPAPPPEVEVAPETAATRLPPITRCANCGQAGQAAGLAPCANRHLTCVDCRLSCGNCLSEVCCLCAVRKCASCRQVCCEDCALACEGCGAWGCLTHTVRCRDCARWSCVSHLNAAGLCVACGQAAVFAETAKHEA